MPHFDIIAQHYNEMTGYPGRIDRLVESIGPWLGEWDVHRALDAGCGNGCLLFALGRLGVDAVGVDAAEGMIRLALDNARALDTHIDVRGMTYETVSQQFPQDFDAIFTLGNALVGASNPTEMTRWLGGLHGSLKPGGHILIQMLNLTPYLRGTKTQISRRQVGDVEYVRTATPAESHPADQLTFSLTITGPGTDVFAHTSEWQAWQQPQMIQCLTDAGFGEIETYGSVDRAEFAAESSQDLVISAASI